MSTNITLKRSATPDKIPTTGDLSLGEIAINTYDGKLYIKKDVSGTESIVEISGGGAGGGIADIVEDTTPQLGGDLDTNGNDILFADNNKAIFGTGSDFAIYHDVATNHSYITETGTGHLLIQGAEIKLQEPDGTTGLSLNTVGVVEINHNGSKKLETTATGITITGTAVADGFTGPLSGNATTATTLATARTIGGVSFNGSANINLPGVNTTGNQNTSGSAATLTTARAIQVSGAVTGTANFDGSSAINIVTTNTADPTITLAGDLSGSVTLTNLASGTLTATVGTLNQNTTGTAAIATTITLVADNSTNATNYPVFVDAATGNENPRTDTGFTYNPSTGVLTSTTFSGALSGNSTTATALQTPRTINGVSFNGSDNITVTATATNALTIGSYLTGSSYNGSSAITIAADATSANTGSKLVARDASGNFSAGAITASGLTIGAITLPATDGTNGQVLTTNGAGVVTFADAGGGGGGTSTFLGLTDTPSSYSGNANQLIGVTLAEDGLGFTDEIQISEFILSAIIAPATPSSDSMTMYVTASGTTPNREVSYKMKNELGQEIIISSILV